MCQLGRAPSRVDAQHRRFGRLGQGLRIGVDRHEFHISGLGPQVGIGLLDLSCQNGTDVVTRRVEKREHHHVWRLGRHRGRSTTLIGQGERGGRTPRDRAQSHERAQRRLNGASGRRDGGSRDRYRRRGRLWCNRRGGVEPGRREQVLAEKAAQAQDEDHPERPVDELERDAGWALGQRRRPVERSGIRSGHSLGGDRGAARLGLARAAHRPTPRRAAQCSSEVTL